jgi:hypothetical protein
MRFPCVLGIAFALSVSLQARATLQIKNPAPGTVFNPGQTVVVYVEPSGGPFKSVSIIAPGYINGLAALTSPPYQFSFTVPPIPSKGIGPGINTISVMGTTTAAAGPVFAAVPIAIERADSPQSIAIDRSAFELSVGEELPIGVYGKYSDASTLRITESTQTTYTSQDPSIAAVVTTDGVVRGVAPGSTTIVVRHQGLQRIVTVTVSRNPN